MAYTRQIILLISLIALFLLDLTLGSVDIPLKNIISVLLGGNDNEVYSAIIWDFRLTKALTCVLAGSALSISGLQMQTLFRNALAGPDVLGLTSGASLAVSLVFMGQSADIGLMPTASSWGIALAASAGCFLVFLIMLAVSARLQDNVSLLIIGLMVGAGTASVVSVLQYISRAEDIQTYMIWTFGSLGSLSWTEIQVLLVLLLIGTIIAFLSAKSLNSWLLGPHYAQTLGINIKKSRLLIICSACILTGGVTAFCGPIAFVGLAVPHLTKMLLKTYDHRILIPSVLMGGASLLLFCDIIAQLPGNTQVLPINAITALIGAPVVIWVILKNRIVE